jgi:hypothetical protein
MEDCIVGKKYRLDELLNGDLWENNNLEGDIYEFVGADALSCTFIDDEKKEYTFCKVDGYPKMELVEEVQNDLPLGLEPDDLWPEKPKKNSTEAERKQIVEEDEGILPMPSPRTFKKHCRFKNREHRHGR